MKDEPLQARQLEDASWWFRLRHTPVADAIRGVFSARLSIAYIIDEAHLPTPLPQTIIAVVRRTKLWHRERMEVARELIAHFQDGLDSGSSPHDLAQSFGDVKQVAVLIRRAKKRNRPLWWRTSRRTVQGVVLLPVILLLLYLPIAVRFFIGEPSITHDYVADLNKTALAVPLEQRAWPVYREALIELPRFEKVVDRPDPPHPAGVKPGDPDWHAFEQFVIDHADRLALIRRAAAMPGFGFVASPLISEDDRKLWPEMGKDERETDGSVISVMLPYLTEMRRTSYLLVLDIRRAATQGNAEMVIANIAALTGIVRHTRENPRLIGDLVALAIAQMTLERVGDLIADQPELFSDDQLQHIAHTIAAMDDSVLHVRVGAERYMFHDILQRLYTDDGSGDGRITWSGVRMLNDISYDEYLWQKDMDAVQIVTTPAVAMLVASRKDMLNEYERIIAGMERNGELPLWERDSNYNNLLATLDQSIVNRIRWMPIVRLLPAIDHATLQHEYVRGARDAMLVAIALELHRRRHGAWPRLLDELVPSVLPSVPMDRFDGQPLRYGIVDGKPRLYSVGANRIDDGGVHARETHQPWRVGERSPEYHRPWHYPQNPGDWVIWPERDETQN